MHTAMRQTERRKLPTPSMLLALLLLLVVVVVAFLAWQRRNGQSRSVPEPVHSSWDCGCFLSSNIFIDKVGAVDIQRHFTYENAAQFEAEHAGVLRSLSQATRRLLVEQIRREIARREAEPVATEHRRQGIARVWRPLQPAALQLREQDFAADCPLRPAAALSAWPELPGVQAKGRDMYFFPVLTPAFCRLLSAELEHAVRTIPRELHGRVNSMNHAGFLLHELGLTASVTNVLVARLQPLIDHLFPRVGRIDSHRCFTVHYDMHGDQALSTHYDNSEVTLNINLDGEFKGGDLVFLGRHGGPSEPELRVSFENSLGWGLLHLGSQFHRAQPITAGHRKNLILWCRSSSYRQKYGCPMCGETDRLQDPPST
eukprot:m.282413 g.282413  ORF g.282413 m.282413 type:complete len:371 (-) comp22898_c3_seq22:203-1315(-)